VSPNVVPPVIRECGAHLGELGMMMINCFPAGSAERLYGDMLVGVSGAVGESANKNDLAPMHRMMAAMAKVAGDCVLPSGLTVRETTALETARLDGTNN
jgi:hypothetical protein